MSRTRSFAVQALLALLLLAQGIAQAHGYAHLRAGQRDDGPLPGGRVCAECCLASALVHASGAPAAPVLDVGTRPGFDRPLPATRSPESVEFHAFRSRAPPQPS